MNVVHLAPHQIQYTRAFFSPSTNAVNSTVESRSEGPSTCETLHAFCCNSDGGGGRRKEERGVHHALARAICALACLFFFLLPSPAACEVFRLCHDTAGKNAPFCIFLPEGKGALIREMPLRQNDRSAKKIEERCTKVWGRISAFLEEGEKGRGEKWIEEEKEESAHPFSSTTAVVFHFPLFFANLVPCVLADINRPRIIFFPPFSFFSCSELLVQLLLLLRLWHVSGEDCGAAPHFLVPFFSRSHDPIIPSSSSTA